MTATTLDMMKDAATARIGRKKTAAYMVMALIGLYLAYVFFAFDIPGLAQRARMDNAATLVSDSWSYKTHVTRDHRSGAISYAIEGQRKGAYPEGERPEWVSGSGDAVTVELKNGHSLRLLPGNVTEYHYPGTDPVTIRPVDGEIVTDVTGPAPDWITLNPRRVGITTEGGRVTVTRTKTEVFRYSPGWELFFFTLDSPYHGHGPLDILFGERIDPDRPNIAGAWHDFWYNPMWLHARVAWAIFETMLMAFLGTFGAALIALPLAFLAAKRFAPLMAVRFGMRRIFDFIRGVDGLIWTVVLSRAFGPGPMTGALAILLTDTGTFGKTFSETLENVDDKQIDGIASTGANPAQRYRFGVLPQVTPVLLSQVLYLFESNTRSATIIGAITGGGIGLLLTQALQTQQDWEEVSYYIVLVVLMVMAMDWFSGWLRARLIGGKSG